MHYSDFPGCREPRTFRVAMGSVLAIAGLTYGLFVAVPEVQQSLSMQSMAQTLGWAELVQRGIGDNAHIQLRDVEIPADDNQLLTIQKMIAELDPQGDRAAMQKRVMDSLRAVDTMQLLQQSTQPLKIIPRGIAPDRVPAVVVMSRLDASQTLGRAEVDMSSTLTGYVRRGWDLNWLEKPLGYLGQYAPELELDQRPQYVISAMHTPPELNWAIGKAVACGTVSMIGWVMAGSAGPSFWGILFMPIPSFISLLGYPIRYGRGGRLMRLLYFFVGLTGIIGGGYLAWYPGQLTSVGGDTLLQSLGYIFIVLGSAAVLGSRVSARHAPLRLRSQPARDYKDPEQGFSIAKVDAQKSVLEQPEAPPSHQYQDPRLSDASESPLPRLMDAQVSALGQAGFDAPKQVMVHDDHHRQLTALLLGCHQIVLCEIAENGHATLTRLVSVLSDGLVIVTLSASTPKIAPLRVGVNGVYSRAKAESAAEMLPEHLDRTVSIAEERHAQVVPMDDYERLDVFLLARRVMIDIQTEYKESKWTVLKANYGRFAFPGRSLETYAVR